MSRSNGGFGDDVLSGGSDGPHRQRLHGERRPGDDTIDRVNTNGDPIDINGGLGNDTISTSGTFVGGCGARRTRRRPRSSSGAAPFSFVAATVDGGLGPDVITGSAQILGTVFGGLGNDTMRPGRRRPSIDCGLGRDSYVPYAGQTAVRCEIRASTPPSA